MTTTSGTLALDAGLALATALLYGYVGRLTLARPSQEKDGRTAIRLFAVWWFGLAIITVTGAIRALLAAAGILDLPLHMALSFASLLPLVAAIWGLLYYLLYIYTGNRRFFWPVTVAHAGILVYFTYLTLWLDPLAVKVSDWSVTMENARTLTGAPLAFALFLILGPVMIAAIGYGSLAFRTQDPTTRYRVAMVSGAFILWFGSAVVASATMLGKWYWWPLAARGIALFSTLLILAAYRPPGFVRRWLGVAALPRTEEPSRPDLGARPTPALAA